MSLVYELIELDRSWLEQMSLLEHRAQLSPWTCELIEASLSSVARAWGFVDRKQTEPCLFGFILVGLVLDQAEILTVSIEPKNQRQGLGKALLSGVINVLKQDGVNSLFLEVRQTNTAGIALYQQLGFERIGKRKNYYRLNNANKNTSQHPFEDAWVMKRVFR